MTDYSDTLSKHRRLAILRHLEKSADYTSNVSILTDVLNGLGVSSSRDQVVTDLTWLKENGFVSYSEAGDFIVVSVTARGVEIALGRARHPEIQRPKPRG